MKFYFAGAESFEELLRETEATRFLVSYYNYRKKGIDRIEEGDEVFLDSGAFTAWSKGKHISVVDYGEFLKKYKDKFKVYANLDVIGDPEATLKNQEYLKGEGLSPLPVVHYKTDLLHLHKYAHDYDQIALGGLVPLAREGALLRNWLSKCFKQLVPYIKDKGLRVHGFGVSSADVLKKYPFYSVDSTAWLSGGKFGTVMNWDDQAFKMRGGAHYKDPSTYLDKGGNLKLQEGYEERLKHNVGALLEMEKAVTRLWEVKGFRW